MAARARRAGGAVLIGYDDMPLAEYLRPPLTTVRTPLAELGAAAVDALVDQLLGGEPRDVVVGAGPGVVVGRPPESRDEPDRRRRGDLLRAALDSGDLDSSGETIVVRLTDEDGRTGIGEADAPALAVRELVLMDDIHAWSRGLRGLCSAATRSSARPSGTSSLRRPSTTAVEGSASTRSPPSTSRCTTSPASSSDGPSTSSSAAPGKIGSGPTPHSGPARWASERSAR